MHKTLILAAATAMAAALPAFAQEIEIHDAYARVSSPAAQSGAIFMVIENHGAEDDRLVGASGTMAERIELHTHREEEGGVMRMLEVEEGFPIPAGARHALERGGDHVMLMGLTAPLEDGAMLDLTLIFESAGEVAVEVPVDSQRAADHGGMQGHGH